MLTGYSVVYRMTAAELAAGAGTDLTGGFIEIVDASGTPTGLVYVTGAVGSIPVVIGGGTETYREAAESITAFSVVYDVDGVHCRNASSSDPTTIQQVLGVSINAANVGEQVAIIRSGVYTGNTGFTAGLLFLGIAGNITHGPATTGVHLQVGNAISATVSDINVGFPIVLA